MNNRRTLLIALIFLAMITACVVPGLPTASTPLPTLTVDTGRIAMMVESTVSAVVALTEQAQPTSTPIPTDTPTLVPTSTAEPSPTATPATQSTQSSVLGPSQSSLDKQADGSQLFADKRAHYAIKLPTGWTAVRINEKEYLDSFSLEGAANTHVQQALLSVQNEDPNVFRLLAIDMNTAHIQNEFVTDMRFVLDEALNTSLNSMELSLSSDDELKAIAQEMPASAEVFRFEVTSVNVFTSAKGMEFGVVEATSLFTNPAGIDVPIYRKQVFFNVPTGLQYITLTTLADLKGTLLPAFDAMLDTVEIIVEE
jgi:hypothetical protein